MAKLNRFRVAMGVALVVLAGSASAELRLPNVFSDHMVLQRDLATRVCGGASPSETIRVTIAGQTLSTTKMQTLIGSWRKAWNQGNFPFYFVQLANFEAANKNPAGGNGWAKIRMAQLKSLQIPHTGRASAIDVGVANDIHPKNKEDVGNRLALWAIKNDYGRKNLVCSGPLYKGITVEGSKIRVGFDYAEHGIMVGQKMGHGPAKEIKGGSLKRFAVSGSNNTWFWADAVIDGVTVLVSSTNVLAPVAVRYAFSMNPEGCNLYNKDGLPASPFRTDHGKVNIFFT